MTVVQARRWLADVQAATSDQRVASAKLDKWIADQVTAGVRPADIARQLELTRQDVNRRLQRGQ